VVVVLPSLVVVVLPS
jgi:hypothetical protein